MINNVKEYKRQSSKILQHKLSCLTAEAQNKNKQQMHVIHPPAQAWKGADSTAHSQPRNSISISSMKND